MCASVSVSGSVCVWESGHVCWRGHGHGLVYVLVHVCARVRGGEGSGRVSLQALHACVLA